MRPCDRPIADVDDLLVRGGGRVQIDCRVVDAIDVDRRLASGRVRRGEDRDGATGEPVLGAGARLARARHPAIGRGGARVAEPGPAVRHHARAVADGHRGQGRTRRRPCAP